ncbi:uncharacterized protein LOC120152360 [Hibiscus syriacus]|uniref:uncharacterized protein LOC120152360 n=1 Tax=Hibiscus syriacus TaxID=106335 RepID=UPI001920BC86|nr:uncharacterized protein LOC120152360 [Hibiscus syriacus]
MAGPNDQPPQEKSESFKQQSSQENDCPNEKSDGDNEGGGGEGQNKTDGVAAAVGSGSSGGEGQNKTDGVAAAVGGGGGGGEGQNKTDDAAAAAAGSSSSPPISTRKRGRTDADGVDVGSISDNGRVSKETKKGDLDVPSVEPTCYVCKKRFGSWKVVFGHLKSHPRGTPGAFPHPSFTPPEGSPERNNNDEKALKDQLAPTLLNLAYETMHKMSQEEDASFSMGGRGWGLDIDLNEPGTSFLLDLNNPPPPEKNDDDGDGDDDGKS